MNISSKPLSVHSGEKLYRQLNHKIGKQDEVQKQNNSAQNDQKIKAASNKISIDKILTDKEVNTLRALFDSGNKDEFTLYGKSKIKNVHSGYLMDVKG